MSTKTPTARIAVNKNELPIERHNGKDVVFMEGNTEFQIEIFNPLKKKIAVDVQTDATHRNAPLLVIRPGERVWLDCDLETKKKFLFETYNVENSNEAKEAIQSNGNVTVKVYQESESWQMINEPYIYEPPATLKPSYPSWPFWDGGIRYGDGTAVDYTGGVFYANSCLTNNAGNEVVGMNFTSEVQLDGSMCVNNTKSAEIETGIIAEGEDTDMNFKLDNTEFNSWPSWIINLKIVPVSSKFMFTKKDIRTYCTECGRRQKKGEKFCPSCGTKY